MPNNQFRILHIGDERGWRGGENQIRLLVQGLKSFGIDCTIAYPKGSALVRRLGAEYPVIELPSGSPLDPRNHFVLLNYISKNDIRIIDAQSSAGLSMGLRLKKADPSLKFVVHRRVDNPIKKQFFSRRKYLSPLVDRFICISNAIADVILNYGVKIEKVRVVRSAVEHEPYQGVDRNFFRKLLLGRLRLSDDVVIVGNTSALTAQKGHDFLIGAAALIRNENFHCVIAGSGKSEDELRQLVKRHGLENKITFLGFVEKIRDLVLGLDILAIPSRNEGLGTAFLEGALAGSALIGSKVGGIPEIIQHQETGLLVEPGDISGLANALKTLITDRVLRAQLAENAKEFVRHEFSVENMIQGNLRIYRELI